MTTSCSTRCPRAPVREPRLLCRCLRSSSAGLPRPALTRPAPRAVDRLSAKDRLWYMSSAICCTLLPLHLYINVLDLELASSQLILAVGCCGASVIGLFRFYHEAAKMKKHACARPLLPRPAPRPRLARRAG